MLYFDDLEEGDTFDVGTETLTRSDIISFAEKWDPQPYHLGEDPEFDTVFDGLVASGLHTLCVGSRMFVDNVGTSIANMGGRSIGPIHFHRPVPPNSTLSGEVVVKSKTRSSRRSDRGNVQFELVRTNESEEDVMQANYHNIVSRNLDS